MRRPKAMPEQYWGLKNYYSRYIRNPGKSYWQFLGFRVYALSKLSVHGMFSLSFQFYSPILEYYPGPGFPFHVQLSFQLELPLLQKHCKLLTTPLDTDSDTLYINIYIYIYLSRNPLKVTMKLSFQAMVSTAEASPTGLLGSC